jgi:hypothetical protein
MKVILFYVIVLGGINISVLIDWPDYFPIQCPPLTAVPTEKSVYRLVRNEPPIEDDFLSNKQEAMSGVWPGKECEACGLSVLNSYDKADKTIRTYKKKFKLHKIAKGTIAQSTGVVAKTFGSGHFTWWLYPGTTVARLFSICSDGEDKS